MKKLSCIIGMMVLFFAIKAQIPSSCAVPNVLSNYYDRDVKHLALQRIYQQNSPYQDSIVVPANYQDSIWQTMAAVFNLTTLRERDSVYNIYCIHQVISNYVYNSIYVAVDTSFSWTHQWMNLQTTTGVTALDSLLALYGFTLQSFSTFGGNYATLTTSQNLNVKPLCNIIAGFSGVLYSEPKQPDGGGDELYYFVSGSDRLISYCLRFGDCPSGCIDSYCFNFTVHSDCSVNYLGVTKSILSGDQVPRPRNCYITSGICQTTTDTLTQSICGGDTFYVGQFAHTQAGNFIDTLSNAGGCDSVVRLALTVNALPVVTFSWDSMVADGQLQANTFGDTIGCALHQYIFKGGQPSGGVYSGFGVSGDTLASGHNHNGFDTIYYTYTNGYGCSATVGNKAIFGFCEGINEISLYNAISLYPNPATNQLLIKTENIQPQSITIYDVNGRMIYTLPFKPEVDVNELSSGVYFVEVMSNEGVARKRFIKM